MNLLICLTLTLAALSPAPEITGTIVNPDGQPVSGVAVSVVAIDYDGVIEKTQSASDGSFEFADLAPGGYGLIAKTESACAISDAIRVDVGFTSVVHLKLDKGLCKGPLIL